MDNIKKNFSIRDLENISGIKAHTIRIWEKRYNLLSPERSKTNIRRSEEHTSELQSLAYLVCRLLLEKDQNRDSICGTDILTSRMLIKIEARIMLEGESG